MRRLSLPLLLFCFLLNVVVLRAQVNRRAAMDHLNRGTKELDAGDLAGALAEFNRAIELANRGIIMLLQGRDADAQKEFDTALRIENTLNPDLQNRVDQIVKGRKLKP